MKAVCILGKGGPEVLRLQEVEQPRPGRGGVTIRVRATAVNRSDLLQCMGVYPAPPGAPADIPGLEYAGEIIETGPMVLSRKVGDRVMGLVGGGAFAEFVVVHERETVPIPSGMDFEQAAALPEAFATALDAMVLQARLTLGEYLLIHAVASGVGTAALQIGALMGATVLGTSRSPEKLKRCQTELGLAHAILSRESPPRFAGQVRSLTSGHGADVTVELVGGSYLPETFAASARCGRVALVGLLAGAETELDLRRIMSGRITLFGTVMRSRPLEEKIIVARAFERQLLPHFSSGRLRAVVDAVFPMDHVQQGFARMLSNETFGKIVFRW
jgi:putative PIG3 family NAD(P)H quinone oxidoreductase